MENPQLKQEVLNFLRNNNVAVIATVSSDDKPQASAVYYISDDDLNFYFLTSRTSRKFSNLMQNSNLGLTVGIGPADITIQGGGAAQLVEDPKEQQEIIKFLSINADLRGSHYWPVLQLPNSEFAVFKFKPSWLVLLNLDKDGHPDTYKEEYHKII